MLFVLIVLKLVVVKSSKLYDLKLTLHFQNSKKKKKKLNKKAKPIVQLKLAQIWIFILFFMLE